MVHSSIDPARSRVEAGFSWIEELVPAGDAMEHTPASGQAQRAQLLALVGAKPVDWAVELGYRVAEQIIREIPVFARNHDGFLKLRTGTESTTLQLLGVLAGAQTEGAATPESLAAVTDFVHRRIGLDDMLRSIQLGHGAMASAFLAECARLADPGETLEQIRALSGRMFRFFDVFAAEMASYYRAEQQRWEGSDAAVKLAMVTELLDGSMSDAIAERKLRYPLSGTHVAIVADGPEEETDALAAAVGGVLAAARCTQRLVLLAAPGVVWAWGSPAAPDLLAAALSVSSLPSQTHAVAGAVAAGSAGFRRSHREAAAGIVLLRKTLSRGRAVAYDEIDLLTLLLSDTERARDFTARELGELAAATPQARDLRRTVAAFIDERGSPHAAAQLLNVSRNTVSYRLKRSEELLGRSVNVRRLQLRCALLIQEIADAIEYPDGQRTPPAR